MQMIQVVRLPPPPQKEHGRLVYTRREKSAKHNLGGVLLRHCLQFCATCRPRHTGPDGVFFSDFSPNERMTQPTSKSLKGSPIGHSPVQHQTRGSRISHWRCHLPHLHQWQGARDHRTLAWRSGVSPRPFFSAPTYTGKHAHISAPWFRPRSNLFPSFTISHDDEVVHHPRC